MLKILSGELKPTSGEVKYGSTVKVGYFAKNHDEYFKDDINLIDFLNWQANKIAVNETAIKSATGSAVYTAIVLSSIIPLDSLSNE